MNGPQTRFRASSFWRTGIRVWQIQTSDEKIRAMGLMLATLIVNLIDIAALGAVMPLINVVVDPGAAATNPVLSNIHNLLGTPDTTRFIVFLGLAVTLLLTISFIGNGLLVYASRLFGVSCQDRLGNELFNRCVHAPFSALIGKNTNTLVRTLVNDVLSWNNDGLQQLIITFAQGTLIIFGIGLLIIASPWVGLVAIFVIGVAGAASTGVIAKQLNRLSVARRQHDAELQTSAYEIIAGIKDVKLSTREHYFINYFVSRFHAYGRSMADLRLFQMFPQLFMMWLGQAGMVLIVFVFWLSGASGGVIAAQMALVLLVTSRVIPAAIRFSNAVIALWKVGPHIDGIETFNEEMRGPGIPPDIGFDTPDYDRALQWSHVTLSHVSYSYPAAKLPSLIDVSLRFEQGRSYGIAGPSGAGKSTLADILLGLLEPQDGAVTIEANGRRLNSLRDWHRRIGYVPQAPLILDASLRANVAFGVPREQVDDSWVEYCVRQARLDELLDDRPDGLDSVLGDRGTSISGGQKQRVAIARALYDRPNLLIFDEATSSLDGVSEEKVLDTVRSLRADVTIVMIAHRLSTIQDCDTIFLLNHGILEGQGTFEELALQSALFTELLSKGNLGISEDA